MRMAVDVCRTKQMVTSLCQPLYSIILCWAMSVNGFSSGRMAGRGAKIQRDATVRLPKSRREKWNSSFSADELISRRGTACYQQLTHSGEHSILPLGVLIYSTLAGKNETADDTSSIIRHQTSDWRLPKFIPFLSIDLFSAPANRVLLISV